MSQSEQVDQIYAALAQAQGEMENAVFDSKNPHFNSKYASLASVTNAIRKALSKHGIALFHADDFIDSREVMVTTLGHKSGQWIKSQTVVPQGLKVQERMAWNTYARRRVVSEMTGIAADEDDDGNLVQKAGNSKGENRHGTQPKDIIEHEVSYDADGNPIDNIPRGDESIERMSKAMARPEYANLQADIRNTKTLGDLEKWGGKNRNRVESLPVDWQEMLRGEYRTKQIELGWKPKELA